MAINPPTIPMKRRIDVRTLSVSVETKIPKVITHDERKRERRRTPGNLTESPRFDVMEATAK
jgi:hypothetical protein